MIKLLLIACSLFSMGTLCSQDILGFWKTIDDQTGRPESIIAIYQYHNRYFGRIIATYDDSGKLEDTIYTPKNRAPGVIGHPFYSGMDILWDLKQEGSRFVDGEILDPEKGRVYGAEIWTQNGKLIVRGKILFFGRNQSWDPVSDADFPPNFQKPDLTKFTPSIPRIP